MTLYVVTAGRRAAEAKMTAECVVKRPTGETVTNPDFTVTPVYDEVYTGRCKIGGDRPYESDRTVGDSTVTVQRFIFHAPHNAGPFRTGDIVEITASLEQPHLIGSVFRVGGPDERSHQTAQRMFVDYIESEAP